MNPSLNILSNKIIKELSSNIQSFEYNNISLRKASEENNKNILFIIKDIYNHFQKNNINLDNIHTYTNNNQNDSLNIAKDVVKLQSMFYYNRNYLFNIEERIKRLEIVSDLIRNDNLLINNEIKNKYFKILDYNAEKLGTILSLGISNPNYAKTIGYSALGTAIATGAAGFGLHQLIKDESIKGAAEPSTEKRSESGQQYYGKPDATPSGKGIDTSQLDIPKVGDTSTVKYNRFSGTGIHPSEEAANIVNVSTKFGNIKVHKSSAVAFEGFLNDLASAGAPIKKFGSYNVRPKRAWLGGSGWSEHSYGNALDIDDAVGFSQEFKKWLENNPGLFEKLKSKWGMKQGIKDDPNHIEFGGIISEEAKKQIEEQREKIKQQQQQQQQQQPQQNNYQQDQTTEDSKLLSFRANKPYTPLEVEQLQKQAGGGEKAIIGVDPRQKGAEATIAAAQKGKSEIFLYHMGPGLPGFDVAENKAIEEMNKMGGWEKSLQHMLLTKAKDYQGNVKYEIDNLDQIKDPNKKAEWIKNHLEWLKKNNINNSKLTLKNFSKEDYEALKKVGADRSKIANFQILESSLGKKTIEESIKAATEQGIPGVAQSANTHDYKFITTVPSTSIKPIQQTPSGTIIPVPQTPAVPPPQPIQPNVPQPQPQATEPNKPPNIPSQSSPISSSVTPNPVNNQQPTTNEYIPTTNPNNQATVTNVYPRRETKDPTTGDKITDVNKK